MEEEGGSGTYVPPEDYIQQLPQNQEDADDASSFSDDDIEPIFKRSIVMREDGKIVMNEEDAPPLPELKWPPVEGCDGKGWGPRQIPEQARLVASINFLNAIEEHDWSRVERLLKLDIDLDMRDDEGRCALHLAIQARHKELVRFLLQRPVDITFVTDAGRTALHFACAHNDLYLVHWLLHIHRLNGDWDQTIHRLTKDDGENALHLAAMWGNVRIGTRLIKRGIDFTCKNKQGQTPADVARLQGCEDFVKMIDGYVERERAHRKRIEDQLRQQQLQAWRVQQPSYYSTTSNDSWRTWREKHGFELPTYKQTTLDQYQRRPRNRVNLLDEQGRVVDDKGKEEAEYESDTPHIPDWFFMEPQKEAPVVPTFQEYSAVTEDRRKRWTMTAEEYEADFMGDNGADEYENADWDSEAAPARGNDDDVVFANDYSDEADDDDGYYYQVNGGDEENDNGTWNPSGYHSPQYLSSASGWYQDEYGMWQCLDDINDAEEIALPPSPEPQPQPQPKFFGSDQAPEA